MREMRRDDSLVRPFVTGKTFLMELFGVLRETSIDASDELSVKRRGEAFDLFFCSCNEAGRQDEIAMFYRYVSACTSKWRPMTRAELSSAAHKNTCYLGRLPILQELFAHWQDDEISRVQALEAYALMKESYNADYVELIEDFLTLRVGLSGKELDRFIDQRH